MLRFRVGVGRQVTGSVALALSALGVAVPSASAAPLSHGRLDAAARYSDARGGFSMVVLRHGRTVYEHYAAGHGPGEDHPLYSGTKSFWGVTAAAAVEDGLLRLDERVSATIEQWRGVPGKDAITVRQLLGLQSGLPFAKGTVDGPTVADQYQAAIDVPLERPPGQAFGYGPAGFSVFGAVLERKLRPRGLDVLGYLRARLLRPAGVQIGGWTRDAAGHATMGSGAALTSRSWARWGAFVLGPAVRTVDRDAFAVQFRPGIIPGYGLGWWRNTPTSLNSSRAGNLRLVASFSGFEVDGGKAAADLDADPGLIVGAGDQGQRLYLDRHRGVVVVRQGQGRDFQDREFLERLGLG